MMINLRKEFREEETEKMVKVGIYFTESYVYWLEERVIMLEQKIIENSIL